jgi:hypothetical protein
MSKLLLLVLQEFIMDTNALWQQPPSASIHINYRKSAAHDALRPPMQKAGTLQDRK